MMVLFDLDGTLVDTTDLILASFEWTFDQHLPGRLPDRDALVHTFGRSLPAVLRELAAEHGDTDADLLAARMLATYRDFQKVQHDTLIKPFPGVAEMLRELRARGRRLGLVTSKREGFARRGLALFGLEELFEIAVFHDDTPRHKPEPDPLLLAAERAGLAPADVVYVGDSIHDVAAGRAAGMRTVSVLWGPFPRVVLERAEPDAIVERPEDLVALLTTDEGRRTRDQTWGQAPKP
jgi:pyrophosphatase PpaX